MKLPKDFAFEVLYALEPNISLIIGGISESRINSWNANVFKET